MVGHEVDEVGAEQFDDEAGDDVAEEHDAFRNGGADEIQGCRENYHVEDVVDETYSLTTMPC